MRFDGKVVIVTGAAEGIAKATVAIFAGEGARVVAVDINGPGLSSLVGDIEPSSGSIEPVEADVLDAQQVQSFMDNVVDKHGRIDILVNAVGGSYIIENFDAPVDELTPDDWDRTVDFNMKGTFLCTMAAAKQMKRQKNGKIINIASDTAHGLSYETNSAYAAAKAGIRTFTKKVGRELGPFGITCNAISPGLTLSQRILKGSWENLPEADRAKFNAEVPLGRPAYPEEQARVIAFLASRDADYVNGVTIDVNGGRY